MTIQYNVTADSSVTRSNILRLWTIPTLFASSGPIQFIPSFWGIFAVNMDSEHGSQPPREEPVNSIEQDGSISPELWKVMMNLVMAIYDYREEDGHDPSRLFHRSVNKRYVPDYYEIIKEPMALSILKARINKREYKQFSEFVRDCALEVFAAEFRKLAAQGVIPAEEAELPDLGEIPEADPLPDDDEEEEEEEEDEDDDSEDEGRRRKKPGPKPGFKRGMAPKNEPDLRRKRGRPPRVDTPMETRIKTILKGIRKFKGAGGHLKITHFERLPDKAAYPDYYMEIKEPIAIDIIKRKSKRKKYASVDHFMRDLDLMFENAKAYNQSDSQIFKDAVDLQTESRKLADAEKKKPDSEFLMEDGRFPLPDGILHRGELWKVGDWVHIQNQNDVTKPIVAQIYRTWQDSDGEKWINACWYYRPEQTVHHFEKHFYPNEVVKTGQYRDHRIDEIVDRCFVMFFTRYSRGRPRDLAPDKEIYVCEARYNEEKHKLNKIKTWASCLPDEVREKDYEMDLFDVPRKIKKIPTPIKDLLKEDSKETDDLPRPTWGADNAPPVVGAVHRRPRDENESPPPEPTPSPPPPSLPQSVLPRQSMGQPLPLTAMSPGTATLQARSPAAPIAIQTSPVPSSPAFQPQMSQAQLYQASLQRRASNFATPQTPGAYQPAPVQQPPYNGYPGPRMQAPPAVYNPNAPRPIEVFHLSDAANATIPEDVRRNFHCDDQGRLLFFSTPPVDYIPSSTQRLGHSLKYLAAKESHQVKVEDRKRKLAEEKEEREGDAKRRRADLETALGQRVDGLTGKALETFVSTILAGTEELSGHLRKGQQHGIDVGAMHQRGLLDDRAKVQTQQIQDQSRTEGLVNLKGTAVYLDEV
ncbi:unnamed protein product [Penicillium salamii]|uniref:Uncharacterized protein n=1 Tax=Penicillium salamii TaxID=1612424 RepID=A0A9W4IFP0_9EURO|nr:unnamed protein product [Penicillium salamii]CAG8246275.1 unnamed protein product [Penicillium salamii]CAG8270274.1 unnamed protein product [Penicillium salamii]CAG8422885.1 unnamed protein product [Penicillium salamii]